MCECLCRCTFTCVGVERYGPMTVDACGCCWVPCFGFSTLCVEAGFIFAPWTLPSTSLSSKLFLGIPCVCPSSDLHPNWFFFCGLWGSNSGAMFAWQTLATRIARHVSVQMATDQEGNEENTFSCLKVNPTHLFLNANTLIAYCFRRWVCLCVRGGEGTSVKGSISLWGFILSWSQNCPWLSQGQFLESYSHG